MRLDDFVAALPSLWLEGPPARAATPAKRLHAELLAETEGMGSENKLAVLDLAGRHLRAGEVYLEAGAWKGTSICAAAMYNPAARFITVDNFSQFGGPKEVCQANIQRWTSGNVQLHDSDFWSFLRQRPLPGPVGAYFYDAGHEYWEQWRALEVIEPFLADEALIIVDDASWPHVAAANTAFVTSHPRFSFIERFRMDAPNGRTWWNGLDVIAYRRSGPEAAPAQVRAAYRSGLLRYGLMWRALDLSRHGVRVLAANARRVARKLPR